MRSNPPVDALFGALAACFHEAYAAARQREAHQVPVLAVLAETLVLVRRGVRSERSIASEALATAKTVAHIPVALFAAVYAVGDAPLQAPAVAQLARLEASLTALADSLAHLTGEESPALLAAATSVLSPSGVFVRHVLARGRGDAAALSDFARRVAERLDECTALATELQLSSIHAHVTEILHGLDPWERRTLHVVVAGGHQARARSLPMQYFERLLDEAPGAEVRLAYGEGVTTAEDALALVGTRRVDVAIARAFFGDPRRLQRDVLGDAAAAQLARSGLESLGK
jgi:hypothetical protein